MSSSSESDRRSGIGSFFRYIFTRSHSAKISDGASATSTSNNNTDKKSKKRKSSKNSSSSSADKTSLDFGIADTEKLQHFQRAKPPPNRRRPMSSQTTKRPPSSSSGLIQNNSPPPTPIAEEEEEELEIAQPSIPPPPHFSQSLSMQLEEALKKRFSSEDSPKKEEEEEKVSPRKFSGHLEKASKKDESLKMLSKSEPDLTQNPHLEVDESEEGGLKKSGNMRSFWHLLRLGSAKRKERESHFRHSDQEGRVEVRRKFGKPVYRSESVGGGGTYTSYRELIQARKSTPPLSESVMN